jgi:nitrous-oxide reductase
MLFNWRKAALLSAGLALTANVCAIESLSDVMKRRGLTEKDILAAAKTYMPTGQRDEYIAFSSGGQSGQVIVYGIPSMRILKYIAVFTPEPWQGYGFDEESKAVLAQGRIQGKDISYGDTHHPAMSETDGKYDGKYLFINDKANPRIALIDLHDFETKQIVVNPVFKSSHGGAFVSENTEYVMEAAQYPAPFENEYVPLEQFNERYRGGMTYWRFDRKQDKQHKREIGRIVPEQSFTVMAPPYSQDLSDFGKGPSSGWSFTNSFCSERYVGGIMRGKPPFEAGCSAKDTDFMHVVNWKKAAELVKAGKATKINGHDVLTIETAVKEGILYLIPEHKSPHGVDVSPDGKYIIVSGKLDSHASVYSFAKIQKAIADGNFEGKDPYGIPILTMKDTLHTQVPVGLGPLHTQYDSKKCVAYTSIYVDSQVTKWDYCKGKVLDKISIHYNIGHLMTMEGDSVKPEGKYLVALNKLAIDRFNPVGPLHPQNHQLIDISGDKMVLLKDMPVPLGEPHYVVAINAKNLKPINRYKRDNKDGHDPRRSKDYTRAGREKIVKTPGKVEVWGTTIRSHITPEIIEAVEGDEVIIHLTNLERAEDETHGFAVYGQNINLSLEPGKTVTARFVVDKPGVIPYYCTEFCSALHLEMEGYLLVKPKIPDCEKDPTALECLCKKDPTAPGCPDICEQDPKPPGCVEPCNYTKADYDKQVKTNVETQAVIDSVVNWILSKEQNYKDFPPVVALVEDAVDQLNFAKEFKAKSEAAAATAEKEDGCWEEATLWAGQWWQYQVKAADIGLRAKTYLKEHKPKTVK